jgi:hypothetical protein
MRSVGGGEMTRGRLEVTTYWSPEFPRTGRAARENMTSRWKLERTSRRSKSLIPFAYSDGLFSVDGPNLRPSSPFPASARVRSLPRKQPCASVHGARTQIRLRLQFRRGCAGDNAAKSILKGYL